MTCPVEDPVKWVERIVEEKILALLSSTEPFITRERVTEALREEEAPKVELAILDCGEDMLLSVDVAVKGTPSQRLLFRATIEPEA